MNFRDYITSDIHTVGIAGHLRPDGDCIGSCLSVYNYLKKNFNLSVTVYLEAIPHTFDFLPGAADIVNTGDPGKKHDLFIALDCGDLERLGIAKEMFENADFTICIDHHKSNPMYGKVNDVRPDASSACEIAAEWIGYENIDKDIAECIYTGLVTDTGVFQYSCCHRSTMELAGILMEKGIDYSWIVNHVFFEKTIEQQKLLGITMHNAKLTAGGRVIYSLVTQEDMKSIGALPKHFEGISAQLRSTRGVSTALLVQQNADGTCKISVRTDGLVDAACVCQMFGGGGHERAAGATLSGDPYELIPRILEEIEKRLDA